VESAEEFSTGTLISLPAVLKLAKRLADAQLGRFIFVFSPFNKLGAVVGLGALSRATIFTVGDLSREATLTYLTARGCPKERAIAMYGVIGGHLTTFVDNKAVNLFCGGAIDQDELQARLMDAVGTSAYAVY